MKKFINDFCIIIGITLIFFLLVEIAFTIYYNVRNHPDPRTSADCYKDSELVDEIFKEFNACNVEQWQSYVYWRRQPFTGKYVNINKDGFRNTVFPISDSVKSKPPVKLFFFGGSTMWGSGVRDEQTIPSLVGANLSKQGYNIDIVNFGETGYVNTQEMISLMLQLQKGNVPSIAVFYDGVNDVFSAYQQRIAGIPQNEYNREREFNVYRGKKKAVVFLLRSLYNLSTVRFIYENFLEKEDLGVSYSDEEMASLSKDVIDIYSQNVRNIHSLANEYDFVNMFYWQPSIFDKKILTEYETGMANSIEYMKGFSKKVNSYLVYENINQGSLYYSDISDIFYDEKEPVFIDYCHVCEYGNIEIAERMAKDIVSVLESSKDDEKQQMTPTEKINIDGLH